MIGQYGPRGHHALRRVDQARNNDNGTVQTRHQCMVERRAKGRAKRQVNATLEIAVVSILCCQEMMFSFTHSLKYNITTMGFR